MKLDAKSQISYFNLVNFRWIFKEFSQDVLECFQNGQAMYLSWHKIYEFVYFQHVMKFLKIRQE